MKNDEMIEAMEQYGGGFVQALAEAMRRADNGNYMRLVDAFPDFCEEYAVMAEAKKSRDEMMPTNSGTIRK